MSTAGIIFANLHDNNVPELTRWRTMCSVPFACRYRLIDFSLSNMINSGITNVHIVTNQNYQSLSDHIGSGKDWDLARRTGGIKILAPYMTAFANNGLAPRSSRLEALKSISSTIYEMNCDNIVLCDGDGICNVDIAGMVSQHEKTGADMTFAVKSVELTPELAAKSIVYTSNEDGLITDALVRPNMLSGTQDVGINIMVVTKRYLQIILHDAIARGCTSLSLDIIAKNEGKYMIFRHDDFYASPTSMESYYMTNMQLLESSEVRNSLFNVKNRSIYTKIRNSPPTNYVKGSKVVNSLIADGCVIEGTVENCIIFRGVRIGKGAVVKNSILFQDTYVCPNASLDSVITDKNVVIRDGRTLVGYKTMPFYIEKGKMI